MPKAKRSFIQFVLDAHRDDDEPFNPRGKNPEKAKHRNKAHRIEYEESYVKMKSKNKREKASRLRKKAKRIKCMKDINYQAKVNYLELLEE